MADDAKLVAPEERCEIGQQNAMPPPSLPVKHKKVTQGTHEEGNSVAEMKETEGTVAKPPDASEESDEHGQQKAMPPPLVKPKDSTKETRKDSKSAAQLKDNKETAPKLQYKVPTWSGVPEDNLSLEVLKNGCIISSIDLTAKPYHVFGRLSDCDVVLEHPSASRHHAVLQYKAKETETSGKGLYVYDFGSTHGTFVNKTAIEPKRYYRVRAGYVIKFGGSSRLYIVQGPEEPEEGEEEADVQEEQQQKAGGEVGRVMTEEEYEKWKEERERPTRQEQGIDWGMGEDAVEEPLHQNATADQSATPDEHHFKDPKKTLRGFFEREGLELEYEVEETGPGHARVYHCRVKLPIDTAGGEPLYADATVTGKKREAVLACAAEACRMLDAAGLLRQAAHESKKKKAKNWEEDDFYDSDEDSFLDRTGAVERKRQQRMKKAGKKDKSTERAETFETLTSRLQEVQSEISSIHSQLEQASLEGDNASRDSLDAFMSSIGTSMDKSTRAKLKRKIFELKKEQERLHKLIEIARPVALPALNKLGDSDTKVENQNVKTPNMASDETAEKEGVAESARQRPADIETEKATRPAEETPAPTGGEPPRQDGFAVPSLLPPRAAKPRKDKKAEGIEKDENKAGEERQPEKEPDRKRTKSPEKQPTEVDLQNPNEAKEPTKKKKKKSVYSAPTEWQAISDPTYSGWIPPEGQTGDGRTSLNDKYGY